MATNEDFIWRFKIGEKPLANVYSDPLLELIRVQWEQLLRLCIPMVGAEIVKVDGFALMRDASVVHPIFPDDNRLKG